MSDDAITCDLLVIGAGAGGFAAAITAKKLGLDVLILEKESTFGGTTALSGGWLWIPGNPLARRAGVDDSPAEARRYLMHEAGAAFDGERVDAFLAHGPRMVEFFQRETAVQFMTGGPYPDYHPDQPGGRASGRGICAQPFDGRELGGRLELLRKPARELTLFGLKVGSGPDFAHFAKASRSPRSALYVLARIARHAADVLLHGRDLLLMSGNALAARLAKSAFDLGIPLWLNSPAQALLREGARVTGAIARHEGRTVRILARRGVVCAAGGFSHDQHRRKSLFPHAPEAGEHHSLCPPGNTGDGLAMAEDVGAVVDASLSNAASWMPVSRVRHADGSEGTYPHSYERGKPGAIAINAEGMRFTNESDSYHDFVGAMLRGRAPDEPAFAWLVGDAKFVRRYGLGIAKPFPVPLGPYLRSSYLKRGATLAALALAIGVDAAALGETVASFNQHAARGDDPDFGRGRNAYNRYLGDAAHAPNPCLAPIDSPPFYAVKVLPGDLGTFMGLKTDAQARVLDSAGRPIEGLYAVGSDMASIFGGAYPGPGINLGPAMTFGYLCAHHAASVTPPGP